MRHPNGYGTVYKLSGKRRKPFIARKTLGWTEDGKQIIETIGYYENRAIALQALADYNADPYDLIKGNLTFEEIYKKWKTWKFPKLNNNSSIRNYESAFDSCSTIINLQFKEIRHLHLQKVIDKSNKNYEAKKRIRILFNQMFVWAIKNDIVTRDYSLNLDCGNRPQKTDRTRFYTDEIKKLWQHSRDNEGIQIILILIYSGLRISEFLNLLKENCHVDKQYVEIVSSKTESGIRVVPIADIVLPFWEKLLERSTSVFIASTIDGRKLSYDNFKKRYFEPLMKELNMSHTIHETRHTFISQMVSAEVNMTIIKKIVGHKSIMNLTEKVYTHPEINELIDAVNSIHN